jgi:hypothetical protein
MRHLICVVLLCAVGCSAVPAAPPAAPTVEPTATAVVNGDHATTGWQAWIPGIFTNLWDTFDARIGMDYGFGAHVKVTDLARIGIFDYSDFSLLGVDRDIFYGEWHWPHREGWHVQTSYDLAFKVGLGLGAEASLHTYELVDWLCWTVTLGYYSPTTH